MTRMRSTLSRRTLLKTSAAALAATAIPKLASAEFDTDIAKAAWLDLLGAFPESAPPLDAVVEDHEPIEGINRFHVRFRSEGDDWVTAWLLVPEHVGEGPHPAIICPHSTTQGAGKDRIIGLCGATHADPPDPPETSRAYGLELARWGYITLSIDLHCDGERVPEGLRPYNSSAFYERHPEWSMAGKNAWDVRRSVDFLETLSYVDSARIGCVGHSLGGHTSLFAAAFDTRIAAAVSNGGMLSWARETNHWSRPPDPSGRPVASYVYIPRFRLYIEEKNLPIPAKFEDLMALVAPRPLLLMSSEEEMVKHGTPKVASIAAETFEKVGTPEALMVFSYPGGHNYPPDAKRLSFAWLDRWLAHTPAIETIWPGKAI